MLNKEQIYDEQIEPLIKQIKAICEKHEIAMLADFAIPTDEEDDLRVTTATRNESGDFDEGHQDIINRAVNHAIGRPVLTTMYISKGVD